MENPHFQIHAHDGETDWRVSVNVRSQDRSDLLVHVDKDFRHPILEDLVDARMGWHHLSSKPGGLALDYIRANLVDPSQLRAMPFFLPGPANDLNELLDGLTGRLRADGRPGLFAFGERWGPESQPDKIFGFVPGNGVHDVHMNQGNERRRAGSDGVWQDGALLFHYEDLDRWVAVFLAFQSQSWQTDDRTGHRLPGAGALIHHPRRKKGRAAVVLPEDLETAQPGEPPLRVTDAGILRIIAYVPAGPDQQPPRLLLMNLSPTDLQLDGWSLLDGKHNSLALSGVTKPAEVLRVDLPEGFGLDPDRGGTITVVDNQGMRVDGVRCARRDLSRDGWAIVF
jgi:uncharacterized protein YukJ